MKQMTRMVTNLNLWQETSELKPRIPALHLPWSISAVIPKEAHANIRPPAPHHTKITGPRRPGDVCTVGSWVSRTRPAAVGVQGPSASLCAETHAPEWPVSGTMQSP